MKFTAFVVVVVFAALTRSEGSTSTATTNAASADPVVTTSNPSGTSDKVSTAKDSTSLATEKTATVTTPKPLTSCKNGTCGGNTTCYSGKTFNGKVTCETGKSCAVHEHEVNATFSSYTLSCEASDDCKKAEKEGTAACCETDNCVPDLKAAKAKAQENKNKSGCDTVRLNLNIVVSMAFMLIIIL